MSDALSQPIPADKLAVRPLEAAKMLSICPRTLWQLTKDGHIRCRKIGTGKRPIVLYSVDELRKWLADSSNTNPN